MYSMYYIIYMLYTNNYGYGNGQRKDSLFIQAFMKISES
jgi:hypothetical protein